AGDEVGDLSAGLPVDLWAGAFVVGLGIHRVEILVRLEIFVWVFFQYLPAFTDGAVRSFHGVTESYFCAVGLDNPLAFHADVGGNHKLDGVTQYSSNHGQGDPGIAGSGVQDRFARPQFADANPFLHHAQRGTVLHRATGVKSLELGKNPHARRYSLGDPANLQQGRVADEVENRFRLFRFFRWRLNQSQLRS